jgi:hypothetical protein
MQRSGRYLTGGTIPVFPGGAEENHKNILQNSSSPRRDFNWEPPKYKTRTLPPEPNCSVIRVVIAEIMKLLVGKT